MFSWTRTHPDLCFCIWHCLLWSYDTFEMLDTAFIRFQTKNYKRCAHTMLDMHLPTIVVIVCLLMVFLNVLEYYCQFRYLCSGIPCIIVLFVNKGNKYQSITICFDDIRKHQGAVSIRKTVLPGMAIPMLKIRRPNGRLIFNIEIAIRR